MYTHRDTIQSPLKCMKIGKQSQTLYINSRHTTTTLSDTLLPWSTFQTWRPLWKRSQNNAAPAEQHKTKRHSYHIWKKSKRAGEIISKSAQSYPTAHDDANFWLGMIKIVLSLVSVYFWTAADTLANTVNLGKENPCSDKVWPTAVDVNIWYNCRLKGQPCS